MQLIPCQVELDLGKCVNACDQGNIAPIGCASNYVCNRRVRTGRTFSDLLDYGNYPNAGTVESTANVIDGRFTYTKVRIYPVFVHYLKAYFPVDLFDVPKNYIWLEIAVVST